MKNLELQKCILGSVYTNCYFLKNKTTGELLIIDPADAPERIVSKVNEMQATPVAILLTHGHFDHIMAADAVRKKYGISVYACSEEVETLQNAGVNLSQYHGASVTLKPDVLLADLQVVDLAGFSSSDDRHTRTYQRKLLLLYSEMKVCFSVVIRFSMVL